MALLEPLLGRLLGAGGDSVAYECRDCGTTLDGEEGNCPNCGSDSIARYDLT